LSTYYIDKMLTMQLSKTFLCETCDYNTSKQSEMSRHLLTNKHKRLTNVDANLDIKNTKIENIYKCNCGKIYKYRQSLSVHKKTCNPPICTTNEPKQQLFTDEMFMELIKQNKELQTLLLEQQKMVMEQNNKICSLIQTPTINYTNL
jgi:hypothetical protein